MSTSRLGSAAVPIDVSDKHRKLATDEAEALARRVAGITCASLTTVRAAFLGHPVNAATRFAIGAALRDIGEPWPVGK